MYGRVNYKGMCIVTIVEQQEARGLYEVLRSPPPAAEIGETEAKKLGNALASRNGTPWGLTQQKAE